MKPSRVRATVSRSELTAVIDHDVKLFAAPATAGGTLHFTLSDARWQILRDGVPLETGGSGTAEFEVGLMRFHELSSSHHAGTKRGWNGRRRWHGWAAAKR